MMSNEIQTEPAQVSGEAGIIRAAPVVMTATIQVTRAATGKVEEFILTGTPEQPKEPE